MHTMPFLLMRGISKRYGGTQALRDVTFSAESGEVHAIVGENGAGKTTLVRIVTGAVRADAGEILLDGTPRDIDSPLRSQRLGIRVVHQHVSLVSHLTVTENILLGDMPTGRVSWWIDWREARRRAERILADIGFARIHVRQPVSRLSYAQRKLVEIAKACAVRPRMLIMDEPSAALSHEERARLFTLIGRLRANSTSILYISHDLDEVFEIADKITVLRDGAVVGTVRPADADRPRVIEMMVGRVVEEIFPQRVPGRGAEMLRVSGLSSERRFIDVSFSVAQGEIVGLYGLIGSGRTEVARCIFGADRATAGEVHVNGRPLPARSPRGAVKAGVAMLTEDRVRDGLVLSLSTRDNVTLANFERMSRLGILRRRRQTSLVESKTAELNVRPRDIERRVQTLSGGNQQKVVLAKWLLARATVLVLDEPTSGVDIATKQEIYRIIGDLVAGGMAVLLISSELPEILGLSDRILVMRRGQLVGEFSRAQATEESLVARATGVSDGPPRDSAPAARSSNGRATEH